MSKSIPVGTLVQVREDALKEGKYANQNAGIVADNGWLWIVEEYDAYEEVYTCRSVATGEGNRYWYPRELNVMKKENTDG